MKKRAGMIGIICFVLFAGGCAKGDNVRKTTLYVEDGKVTEAIVEKLDEEFYDEKKMEDWITKDVDAYNKEHGSDVLKIVKCEVEGETAKATIEYDSMKDYGEFNGMKAFCGTIREAEKAGYDFEGEFESARGKPVITHDELENSESYYAVIVSEAQEIVLEEEILYASPNVSVKGKKAVIDKGAGNHNLAYIIYKP